MSTPAKVATTAEATPMPRSCWGVSESERATVVTEVAMEDSSGAGSDEGRGTGRGATSTVSTVAGAVDTEGACEVNTGGSGAGVP
jgi:hypothetical protein